MGIFSSKRATICSGRADDNSGADTSLLYSNVLSASRDQSSALPGAEEPTATNTDNRKKRRKVKKRKTCETPPATSVDMDVLERLESLSQTARQFKKRRQMPVAQQSGSGLAFSEVSREQISAYVANILRDPAQNVWMVPDRVEGALYESAIQIAVGAIAHVLESTRVELLGHEIRFVLTPLTDSTSETTEDASQV